MFRRSLKNLLSLLLGMTWLAQSFLSPHHVAALPPKESSVQIFPCDGMALSFRGNTQGWHADGYSSALGKLDLNPGFLPQNPEGGDSLALRLDLAGTGKSDRSAQFYVDLVSTPPGCAPASSLDPNDWWEEESLLSIWVWAPHGTRGNPDHPNGLHLYMQDDSQEGSYGTWQTFQEETWFEVTLRLDNESPVCGEKKAGFEYSLLRRLGLNVSLNADEEADPIHGTIYISPMQIKSKDLALPASDHSYTFDAVTKERPQWNIVTDPLWQAQAFTRVNIHDGARVVDVDFHVDQEDDPHRKGVLNLVYAPDLNLGDAYHLDDFFSLDIRFDPPPDLRVENCPFSLKLWAFDSGKKVQFDSINQDVGSDQWTRVAFRLGNLLPSTEGAKPEDHLDTSRIGKIGFQIYAGTSLYKYQGQVWIDNIAIGNATYDEPPPTFPLVERTGPYFTVEGQRFRFVGANAEYLPYKPDQVVTEVLDRAQSLGIHVIRTWGFGEGCEDYYLPNCEDVSLYFQPKPGEYNQAAFEHFDRIVYEAGKRNIRLIVPLVNNWYEHGGIPRYVCWRNYPDNPLDCNVRLMSEKDHDSFYTDSTIRGWYQDYVKYFITRKNTITGTVYANDPTIMAWELINEPRSKSDPSGQYLHQWIADMGKFLKEKLSPAPVQLIGTGEEGWYILPKEAADTFDNWQVFHKNYWHYGVNWAEPSCIDSFGSNGTDFLSDNSSDPRTVKWQMQVSNETSSPTQAEARAPVKQIGFTGIHLYLSPAETGLSYAPYCYYYGLDSLCSSPYDTTNERTTRDPEFQEPVHQAKEWINQHVETAHKELVKPFLLEEFNFPVPSKTPLGVETTSSGDAFQVTPDERARLFSQYLDFSYDMDVDAVLFWNLGYDGFLQQPWSEIDALRRWEATAGGRIVSDTSDGIRFSYSANKESSMELSEPKVDWLRAEGNQVMVDLFNEGDAQEVVFEVQLSGDTPPRSKTIPIQPGENKFLLGELFAPVQKLQSKTVCPLPKEEPPKVKKITVTFPGSSSSGSALFNFTTIFNNKYVIFPGDPVEDVIHRATSRWEAGFRPTPPKVVINQNITCNDRINPELINRPLPIYFKFNGSIEHADGYYYRYSVASPGGQYESDFGTSGLVHHDHIAVTANAVGKYEVKIAPEGESFDSPSAASCNFSVMNDRPVLTIESIRFNGQEFQPHEILTVDRDVLGSKQVIEIRISGIDDVSSELNVVCRLLKGNREVDSSMLSCPAYLNATTQKGGQGTPASVTGILSPGNYQLQLWLQDKDSAISGVSTINIVIPNSWIHDIVALIIILSLAFLGLKVIKHRKQLGEVKQKRI